MSINLNKTEASRAFVHTTPTFAVKDKVIAITGGASGIGYATAMLLAAQGAKVAIMDVNKAQLDSSAAKLKEAGGSVMATVVDVRDGKQVEAWIEEIVKSFGKLDGAANLAGVIPKGHNLDLVEEMKDDDWNFVMDVNLTGVMYCMRAQIRNMNAKGSIVNAASVAGLGGFPKNAAYNVSKHGVIGLTKTAAKEVADRLIRVNAIAPGIIDTEMHRESERLRGRPVDYNVPIKRKGHPEEVASLIAWLLCDGSPYITGTVQIIDGGLMA